MSTNAEKLNKTKVFAQNKDLALFQEVQGINEGLESIKEAVGSIKLPEIPPLPEKMAVTLEGVEIITLKGDQGEKGDPGIDGIGKDGVDGKNGKDGKDGLTPVVDYEAIISQVSSSIQPSKDGVDGKDGSPDTGEQIVEKINDLPIDDDNLKIDYSHIKNIPEKPVSIRGGKTRIFNYDLSSQCDGVIKTFNVPLNLGVIGLYSTQAPIIYRPIIDFTEGNGTLTLTSEVGAPQTGQTLICQVISI